MLSTLSENKARFAPYNVIITTFFVLMLLGFELIPNTNLVVNLSTIKIKDGHLILYQKPKEYAVTIAAYYPAFFFSTSTSGNDNNRREKLIHSSFRLKETILKSLDIEARKRGFSLSTLVNRILENYITNEMYFEELGFLLVSKDFLRKAFDRLSEGEAQDLGRELGLIAAREYVTYFFPEVNVDSLVKFLDLWFKRFQSYQHRIDSSRHYYIVNHEINLNF